MWKRLKSHLTSGPERYVGFFRLALEEQFPHATYRPLMKAAWTVAIFGLSFVISDFLGIPLKDVLLPVMRSLPAVSWVVIVLLLAVACLLLAINGARHFHEKTVNGIYDDNDGIRREYSACADRIEMLTNFKGRFNALCSLLGNRGWNDSGAGLPLLKEEIAYQEGDFSNMLQDHFGTDLRNEHFTGLGEIPDTPRGQSDRMRMHVALINRKIHDEVLRRYEIKYKARAQRHVPEEEPVESLSLYQ